ncbi:hypothetical protein BLOT_002725 [Blomia tropicalis]|nr:hypothetical protein BLOT_002725 [Blomia tropicalis]
MYSSTLFAIGFVLTSCNSQFVGDCIVHLFFGDVRTYRSRRYGDRDWQASSNVSKVRRATETFRLNDPVKIELLNLLCILLVEALGHCKEILLLIQYDVAIYLCLSMA